MNEGRRAISTWIVGGTWIWDESFYNFKEEMLEVLFSEISGFPKLTWVKMLPFFMYLSNPM